MTLRNLNQRKSRGRILGTPKTGVLGALIPSTGANGPGYAYPSLSLPADAVKEICGYITSWPTAGVLDAGEDTGFTLTGAPDGVYTFQFQLQADGVEVGTPRTATITQTTPGVMISCIAGNAVAGGLNATITTAGVTTIICQVGVASAACPPATITQPVSMVISCHVGSAAAGAPLASILQPAWIRCLVGDALAGGPLAAITNRTTAYARAPDGHGYIPQHTCGPVRPANTQGTTR